ncbi:MAG: hypothetical protein CMJ75_18630 [Planctomycetaceae bacterium]|nr:hypothetical protein [Planctomycetaceae bacterium]
MADERPVKIEVVGPAGRIVINEDQFPQYRAEGYVRAQMLEDRNEVDAPEVFGELDDSNAED